MPGLFDHLPDQPDDLPVHESKKRAAPKKKQKAEAPAGAPGGHFEVPPFDTLDPRIYGARRSPGEENYLKGMMTPEQFELWKLRNLPLVCQYTAYHFTARGKVDLLRRRQYSDGDIAAMYPELADALEEG